MISKTITIINPSGLHARPASEFVKAAAGFSSMIKVKNLTTGKEVNAKSIVLLLTLALTQGSTIQITCTGADEDTALETLCSLIEGGFGEI